MISKHKENKNFRFRYVKFISLFIFVVGFILGAIGIKHDYIKDFYYLSKDFPNITKHLYYSMSTQFESFEKVNIDLKFKEFQIIADNRERNIKDGHGLYTQDDWAKGRIGFSNIDKNFKAKFRLKGTMSDNWKDENGKWSYRVKLKGEGGYDGLREFSLFRPSVGSGVLEWLFQKIAEREGVLGLNTKLVELTLNGNNLGYYYLQEHYSKSLIEKNNRREGPIVGYKKERLVESWHFDPNTLLEVNGLMISDIDISGNYNKLKDNQKELYNYAISGLEDLRSGKRKPSDILDVDMMAKLLAIRAIIASSELDWKDVKFYYNPLSSKLEPIAREAHAEGDLYDWWYRGRRSLDVRRHDGHTTFADIIFSDEVIYNRYMHYLRSYQALNIVDMVVEENYREYGKIIAAMSVNNNGERWLEVVKTRSRKIAAALGYTNPASIFVSDSGQIFMRNFQNFPITIKAVYVDGKKIVNDSYGFVVEGKINDEPYYDKKVPISVGEGAGGRRIEVEYALYGDDKNKISIARPKPLVEGSSVDETRYVDYFVEKGDTLVNKSPNVVISKTIVTPDDKLVYFSPGSSIVFTSQGQLIAKNGIMLDGNSENRISVQSTEDSVLGGIFVIESDNRSVIQYADFFNLKSVSLPGAVITGSVNFYKSDVDIRHSSFSKNLVQDDYINIFNSEFSMYNVGIIDSYLDSIDIDFSRGSFDNVRVINSGNDGIDLSGSVVSMKDVEVDKSNDKALSVGEASSVDAREISISNSNIAVAVKDGSIFKSNIVNLDANQYDFAAFVKKEEYGPATIIVNQAPEDLDYMLEPRSKITVNNKILMENMDSIRDKLYQ